MEKRRPRSGELLENEDALINTEIIDHLTEAILENVFVALMFQIHRNVAINNLVGLREELEPAKTNEENEREKTDESAVSNGTINSNIGSSPRGKRPKGRGGVAECKCKCFVCHQMIAAVRFAPHLEKCIGIGRAARSRRRGIPPNFMSAVADNELSCPSRSTRSSTLRSAARRMIGNETTTGETSTVVCGAASPPHAAPFLSRRRPTLVEDFTLPPAPTGTAVKESSTAATICAVDVFQNVTIKEEDGDDAAEEPLRDRLRNKTNRTTAANLLRKCQ